ncbi:hypothetical protein C0416_05515 [bacterium]|nr:hypothetical protein [bacterium]
MTKDNESDAKLLSEILDNVGEKQIHFVVRPEKIIKIIRGIKRETEDTLRGIIEVGITNNIDTSLAKATLLSELEEYDKLIKKILEKCAE